MPEATGPVSLGAVFTLLFVTLGPLKVLGPFARLTRDVDDATMKKIAWRSFVLATIAVVVGGYIGRALAHNWGISVPVLLITGGVIFLLVGLRLVLEQYEAQHPEPLPLPASPMAAAMRITFPTVVTPYGVAALIVLLANSQDSGRTVAILAILLGIMVLNLIAMLFARRTMHGVTQMTLQILGAVLGVLQVALALEMLLRGVRASGLLS